jgi:hypothetical protein
LVELMAVLMVEKMELVKADLKVEMKVVLMVS